MAAMSQKPAAFDLEAFLIYLCAELCGRADTCRKLEEASHDRERYMYWRSPILTPAVVNERFVGVPHQAASLIYVDALFLLTKTCVSVQFGGLISREGAEGGQDVNAGLLTLDDLKILFEGFGYDLLQQQNSRSPAANLAKALKGLAQHTDGTQLIHFNEDCISTRLYLGRTASAPLTLFRRNRGQSDQLSCQLLQRTMKKAMAAPVSQADDNDDTSMEVLDKTIAQWKQNVVKTPTPQPKQLPSSPGVADRADAVISPPAKSKTTAAAKPKLTAIRKAPARKHKFGFTQSK